MSVIHLKGQAVKFNQLLQGSL